jgi:hypothetical protein
MNTKSFFRFLGLAASALLLCACPGKDPTDPTNPSDPTDPTPGPGGKEDTPYFRIQMIDPDAGTAMTTIPSELVFPNALAPESGIPLLIDTNMKEDEDWSITTTDHGMCYISWGVYNGKTERKIVCSQYVYQYSPEQYPAPRECDLVIKAGSLFEKTIHLVQQGIISFIMPDYKEGVTNVLSPAGETAEQLVLSNAYKWEASSNADWLTVSLPDPKTLRMTSSPRSDSDAQKRTAVVTLHDLCTFASWQTSFTITITDDDAVLGGDEYHYGDHIDWN